jgi:PhnB protein
VFDALAVGGNIFENIFEAPWGALFGVVTDKYGITWMVNCLKKA